ncbi:MAG: PH domain-containing protein [Actinomycetota bacterium]|nr:PH domain-containing protein [Actinomycetota bacterium]
MPFPPRLLHDNEEVVVDLRPHWLFLVGPSAVLAAAVVVAILVSTWTTRGIVLIPLLLVVLVALGWFLLRVGSWAGTALVVTNHRVVLRSGVLRRGRELALERIDDMTITRTLLARLLGAGDLLIESTGEGSRESFVGCPHPRRVRDEIHHQMVLVAARIHEGQAGGRDLSPLGQLERLDDLRRRGVISDTEFEAKKTQLLGRL